MKRFWIVNAGTPGAWDGVAAACADAWPEVLGTEWETAVWDWTTRADLFRTALRGRRILTQEPAVHAAVADLFWAACHRERPDVIWVLGGTQIPADVLDSVGGLGIRRIAWALDDPLGLALHPDRWAVWDAIWTPEPDWYGRAGYQPLSVPPAVDLRTYAPEPAAQPAWEVAVIGGRMLEVLPPPTWPGDRWLPPAIRWGIWGGNSTAWPQPLQSAVRSVSPPPIDAVRIYGASRVVLNLQEPLTAVADGDWWWTGRRSPAPETLAVAASGAFQIVVAPAGWEPAWPELVTCPPAALAETLRHWLAPAQAEERCRRAEKLQAAMRSESYRVRLQRAWAAA